MHKVEKILLLDSTNLYPTWGAVMSINNNAEQQRIYTGMFEGRVAFGQ